LDSDSVLIMGSGGHAKGVLESILAQGRYSVCGYTSPQVDHESKTFMDYPVLGNDDLIPELVAEGLTKYIIGIGSIGDNAPRKRLFDLGKKHGLTPITVIHPAATVYNSASIESGSAIFAGAIICSSCVIGKNVIVNHGAIIDHDCRIGNHVHIAPGVCLSGSVTVDKLAHIGTGATIIQGVHIGEASVIAAGAVVTHNVKAGTTVRGVPAR